MTPSSRFKNMGLKILRYDDVFMSQQNREEYLEESTNYQTIKFQSDGSPTNGWCAPMNTGHKYKVHFGMNVLDWDDMRVDIGEKWAPTDLGIYMVHNFTDVRVDMDVTWGGELYTSMPGAENDRNDTIPLLPQDYKTGQFLLLNETAIREFHFIIAGNYPIEG